MADAPFSRLRAAARTDRGRVRSRNEDAFLCEPAAGVFAVTDGIGGLNGGDVASRTTADFLRAALTGPGCSLAGRIQQCRDALNAASAWIRQYAAREGYPGMGATVAALLFDPDRPDEAATVHAGDSRVYRLRDGLLEQLTRDHSAASMAGLSPDQAIPSIYQGVITRAVGVRRTVEADVAPVSVREGDLFLLCTDGLYNSLPRDRLAALLNQPFEVEELARRLLSEAMRAGGEDNITFILVRVGSPPSTPRLGERPVVTFSRRIGPWCLSGAVLLLAVLGVVVGVWRVRQERRFTEPAALRIETPTDVPSRSEKPSTLPPAQEPSIPLPDEPKTIPPPWSPAETDVREEDRGEWAREQQAVESDLEAIKRRHAAVQAAFRWLERWSGEPLPLPSLMLAGRLEERGVGWRDYLRDAQRRWLARARDSLARQKEESETLRPERVRALYRWIREGTSAHDPQEWDRYVDDWTAWQRELAAMTEGVNGLSEARPFLSDPAALAWRESLPVGSPMAVRVWDRVWPWMDHVWRRYEVWLTRLGPDRRPELVRLIREANALWGDYQEARVSVGAWRRRAPLSRIRDFLHTMETWLPPEEERASGVAAEEGSGT